MPWAKSFCPFRACGVIPTAQEGRVGNFNSTGRVWGDFNRTGRAYWVISTVLQHSQKLPNIPQKIFNIPKNSSTSKKCRMKNLHIRI